MIWQKSGTAAFLALLALTGFAAWRVLLVTYADANAASHPERALRWAPNHPVALLALAERQLAEGQTEQAVASARRLLAVEPLEARGFRVLAQAAEQSGDQAQALSLYQIAARRSPRDLASQAWLAQHYLDTSDFPQAVRQFETILQRWPQQKQKLLPVMAQMAADPAFSDALSAALQARPAWRASFLNALQRSDDAQASAQVMAALQRGGGLEDAEYDQWIDNLMRKGRWGEAYSRWAGRIVRAGSPLAPVYNGGFETEPGNRGFDWRIRHVPGVTLAFVADPSVKGRVARFSFRGRSVATASLEQPLLLAPGRRYRFSARARAENLRAERGLEWVLACNGGGAAIVVSERLQGSFGWREVGIEFDLPANGCNGQWLRLRNPAPSGLGQRVSGELWLDEIGIAPLAAPKPTRAD